MIVPANKTIGHLLTLDMSEAGGGSVGGGGEDVVSEAEAAALITVHDRGGGA